MHNVLLIIHIIVSIALIGLVLIQHGKGADAGAAFGSGASATVFGSRGASNFLTRASGILATVFFITSLSLAYISVQGPQRASVTQLENHSKAVTEETKGISDKPMTPPSPEGKAKGSEPPEAEEHVQKRKSSEAPVGQSGNADLSPKPTPAEQ